MARTISLLLVLGSILAACASEPPPAPPPDPFEDVLRPGEPAFRRSTPRLEATVEGVDLARNIILLSVGSEDGVRRGMEFTVHREGRYVSTVVVDRVEADWSSAYARRELQKTQVHTGDVATTHF